MCWLQVFVGGLVQEDVVDLGLVGFVVSSRRREGFRILVDRQRVLAVTAGGSVISCSICCVLTISLPLSSPSGSMLPWMVTSLGASVNGSSVAGSGSVVSLVRVCVAVGFLRFTVRPRVWLAVPTCWVVRNLHLSCQSERGRSSLFFPRTVANSESYLTWNCREVSPVESERMRPTLFAGMAPQGRHQRWPCCSTCPPSFLVACRGIGRRRGSRSGASSVGSAGRQCL